MTYEQIQTSFVGQKMPHIDVKDISCQILNLCGSQRKKNSKALRNLSLEDGKRKLFDLHSTMNDSVNVSGIDL